MPSALRWNFAWTAGLSCLGFLTSFASLIIVSYHFGASAELDAYWAAFALMNLLAFPLYPLRDALVPEFHRHLRQGQEVGSAYFSSVMTLILLVAGAGVLVGWLLAGPLTVLAVSGKQPQVRILAVGQLYWLAPAVLLLAVSETMNAILAAYHRVILQSVARLLGSVSTLSVLALFAGILHSHVLPLGFIAAQVTTSLVQLTVLRHHGLSFRLTWPTALGGRFIAVSGALFAAYTASHAYAVFEKYILTSFATGLVSSFQYAVSLTNVVITLVGVTLSNVLWPRFMEHAVAENRRCLRDEVFLASRLTFLITGWLCALVWLNPSSLVKLIYARGAFDAAAVTGTTHALRTAVFAAVPVSVAMIFGRALISVGAARSVMITGLVTALGGCTTLFLGRLLDSPTLALSHWLLANLGGLAIQALLFVRVCGGVSGGAGRAVGWLTRWVGVLVLAGFATQMIPAAQSGLGALVTDIVMRSVLFSVLFGTFAWVAGLVRGFPPLFRR